MSKILCMIPVRLGSQRVKSKNIRYLGDKPLMSYAIDTAKAVFTNDSIYVNSDSDIAKELSDLGGVNFYLRSPKLCSNVATSEQFIKDFLLNNSCDYLVMLNTTSPLITPKTLSEFVNRVQNTDKDVIFSVVKEKAESYYQEKPINFSLEKKINSQDLVPIFTIVWAITAWKRDTFLHYAEVNNQSPIFGGSIENFVIPKMESIDIDTEEDWQIAEAILSYQPKSIEYYNNN